MRRTAALHESLLTLAATLALCVIPALAGAAVLYQDSFSYPNGNFTPNGGWYAHSSGGVKPIQVNGTTVVVQESANPGEDVNHPFPQQLGTARTYSSFKLKLPTGSVVGTANDYIYHFRPGVPDTIGFVTRTYVGPPTAGGDYVFGVAAGSLTSTPLAPWATGLIFGATYNVVVAYDGVTGTSTLWVDPAGEGSTSVSSVSATVTGKLLASVALRQASPTGATYGAIIDDVRVGESFADVGGSSNAASSLNEWGMMLLSAALLISGVLFVTRRCAAVA